MGDKTRSYVRLDACKDEFSMGGAAAGRAISNCTTRADACLEAACALERERKCNVCVFVCVVYACEFVVHSRAVLIA